MAGLRNVCFFYILPVLVLSSETVNGYQCEVRKIVPSERIWGSIDESGTYEFSYWGRDCSKTIMSYASTEFMIVRLTNIRSSTIWLEILGEGGKVLGEVTSTEHHANFPESFQGRTLYIHGTGRFQAEIKRVFSPGSPVNSSLTHLTATHKPQNLTSFGYPFGYPNSMHYSYIITTNEFHHLIVAVHEIQMANPSYGASCSEDYLEMTGVQYLDYTPRQNPSTPLRLCQGRHVALSSGHRVVLLLHTNSKNSQKGFELSYQSSRSDESCLANSTAASESASHWSGCSASSTLSAHTQRSYLAPYYFRSGEFLRMDCAWSINTGGYHNARIMVTVLTFHSQSPGAAWLQLFDGYSSHDDALTGRISTATPVYFTSGTSLCMVFHAVLFSSSPSHELFRLAYQRVPVREVKCNQTTFVGRDPLVLTSPQSQDGARDEYVACLSSLHVSIMGSIALLAVHVHFPPAPGVTGCSQRWIQFDQYGSIDVDSPEKLCSSDAVMRRFPAGRGNVDIQFRTRIDGENKGFSLLVQAREARTTPYSATSSPIPELEKQHGGGTPPHYYEYTVFRKRTLSPPNYRPGKQDKPYLWTCRVISKLYTKLRLEAHEDYWGPRETCDFLDVYDGLDSLRPRLAHWCGDEPLYLHSTGPDVYMEFRASYGSRGRFSVEVSAVTVAQSNTGGGWSLGETVGVVVGVSFIVLIWIALAVCLRVHKRRQRLRALRARIDGSFLFQLEQEGVLGGAEDANPLLPPVYSESPARPWGRRLRARLTLRQCEQDDSPPPYPGLPDMSPRLRDPPPPYTLSSHVVPVPTSDRSFLERPQGAAGDEVTAGAEGEEATSAGDEEPLQESGDREDDRNTENPMRLEDDRSDAV